MIPSGAPSGPHQQASPFFPEVHEELTRSWWALYSAHLRASSSSALISVDGAEEKGYEKMSPLDESVAVHLCPPTTIGWTAKAAHPSKPCKTTSAGQAASAHEEGGLDRCIQHGLGERCARADWLSACGRKRKEVFKSTAWKCWQCVEPFIPSYQT